VRGVADRVQGHAVRGVALSGEDDGLRRGAEELPAEVIDDRCVRRAGVGVDDHGSLPHANGVRRQVEPVGADGIGEDLGRGVPRGRSDPKPWRSSVEVFFATS
jgi:hypothetical protein